mgnify:CR=1 FL=1
MLFRSDTQTPIPVEKDSLYKPIERAERKFAPTRIPLQLQKELPFASKPKVTAAVKRNMKKATQGYLKARKVLLEPEERKKIALLNKLTAIRNVSVSKVLATKSRKRKEARTIQNGIGGCQSRVRKKTRSRKA